MIYFQNFHYTKQIDSIIMGDGLRSELERIKGSDNGKESMGLFRALSFRRR